MHSSRVTLTFGLFYKYISNKKNPNTVRHGLIIVVSRFSGMVCFNQEKNQCKTCPATSGSLDKNNSMGIV